MNTSRILLFSTPLVSTWVFNETYRLLFDAGDGVTALLDSKIHKIKLAAITHTHRDHCAGLMQLLNLRGGAGDFRVVYPEASGSGRVLAQFLSAFDSRSTGRVTWEPVGVGQEVPIEPERHVLRSFETKHYPAHHPPGARSLGYQIVRQVSKVKAEYRGLPQAELDLIRKEKGREFITETLEDILFTLTGDTTPLPPETYANSRILMHECTFLDSEDGSDEPEEESLEAAHAISERTNPHSCLDEVLELARAAKVGRLGLYHVSRRYEDERILTRVRERCVQMNLAFPVSVALPGRLYEDFFAQAVWQGNGDRPAKG